MKFEIKFTCPKSSGDLSGDYAVMQKKEKIGFISAKKILDKAERQITDETIDWVTDVIPQLYVDPIVTIPVKSVMDLFLKKFATDDFLEITVPKDSLTKYVYKQIVNQSPTCARSSFKMAFAVDTEKLLDDWLSAGCPDPWDGKPSKKLPKWLKDYKSDA